MKTPITAQRKALKISQLKLARLAGVSRWKICLEELGEPSLTSEELLRIDNALRKELRKVAAAAQESLSSAHEPTNMNQPNVPEEVA